ncbi:MAG: molybdopterin cofactor-binding domain-containing protein, partial [Pricia sp.]
HEVIDGKQIEQKVGTPSEIKGKTVRKWVGKPVHRTDIEDMVRGKPVFVQDLRFPGMVHARVIRPSGYASRLRSFDESAIENMPGFLRLVRKGSFLGVIAEEEYQAIRLKEKGEKTATWESQEKLPTDQSPKDHIKSLSADTEVHEQKGDVESAFGDAAITHNASYFKPYVMHAANGPSCGVALFKEGKLTVWTHSQGVYPLRNTLAELLKMSKNDIHVIGVPGSGCYGHNGADDAAAEAALMAVEYPGKHIRNQWMRADEHGWEPYGTAMAFELKGALNADGKIQAWQQDIWSDGHSNRPGGNPNSLLPARFMDEGYGAPGIGYRGGAVRNGVPYYDTENTSITSHIFLGPLRSSSLRGLGAYANVFAIECFMDELAHKAAKDPVDFRLMHLDDERAKACLQRLKDKTLDVALKKGEGLGFSFGRYKNEGSYCAVAALVEVDGSNGAVRTKKMWAVIDAGETINPDGLKNQTEGGLIQSASWALKEEVRYDARHITSLDWDSYPIFRFPDTPETEVEVVDRPEHPPTGAGEAAQGPATAAVINAIFDATGVRVRELPVNPDVLKSG